MKKKIFAILLTLCLVISMVACASSGNGGDITGNETDSKSETTNSNSEKENTEIKTDSLEELEEVVNKDVEDTIAELTKEYEALKTEIDTYDKYKSKIDKVETFYGNVLTTQEELTIRLRGYAVNYTELILASDSKCDDKYDEMDEIYDVIYEDAGDDIYDDIYEGILDDMYDVFYDGILDDAYDTVAYSEWSDIRSKEYDMWSDIRSDSYDNWSDCRSDIYDFWSDVRSELWSDNIEKASEEVNNFKGDIEGLKTADTANKNSNESENIELVDGMRPEFKAAMDGYEAFYDKYCELLKKYKANPTDTKLLEEYTDMMAELVDMDEAFREWESDELNSEELKYYIEVSGRISQKLVDVAA